MSVLYLLLGILTLHPVSAAVVAGDFFSEAKLVVTTGYNDWQGMSHSLGYSVSQCLLHRSKGR